jgi:chromosome segregation ATPase
MSGETEKDISGWTVDTLHTHIDVQLRLLREQLARQWQEERRATDKALEAHDEALKIARDNVKEAISTALAAQKEATNVQAETLRQYQTTQNHWRESLNDVSKHAMPRAEAEALAARATERIQEIVLAQAGLMSRAEVEATVRSVRTECDAQLRAAEAAREADRQRVRDMSKQLTELIASARGAADKVKGIYAAIGVAVTLIIATIAIMNFVTK